MRRATWITLLAAGCAAGTPPNPRADAGRDAEIVRRDAGPRDAGRREDAGRDAAVREDAGRDAGLRRDAGMDASTPVDAGSDARIVEIDAGACEGASDGVSIVFDGTDDLASYPESHVITPGAPLEPWERFALSWDRDYLYVTMVSRAFEDQYKPLHVYLESADVLADPVASAGKEYSGRIPELPFAATHLIAVRRTSDSGAGGPYNGVYTPADGWGDRAFSIEAADTFVAADHHTISVRVPWRALGCPSRIRLTAHVVNAVEGDDYKDLVPTGATPWTSAATGYYEIDLSGAPASEGWMVY
jgi:hypothetical protein